MNKDKDKDMNKDKDNDQDKDKAGEEDKKKGADLVQGESSNVWVLTERPSALLIFSFCRRF